MRETASEPPSHSRIYGKNAKLAGETTLVSGIAGRYATALFELARDEDKLDDVAGSLAGLEELLGESRRRPPLMVPGSASMGAKNQSSGRFSTGH